MVFLVSFSILLFPLLDLLDSLEGVLASFVCDDKHFFFSSEKKLLTKEKLIAYKKKLKVKANHVSSSEKFL